MQHAVSYHRDRRHAWSLISASPPYRAGQPHHPRILHAPHLPVCIVAVPPWLTLHIAPARAQGNLPPHAWLFGAWIGGLFPPPSTLSAQECLAQPVVIFTRDIVMRAVITDQLYAQRLVETARATADGAEFRFDPPGGRGPFRPVQPDRPGGTSNDVGFGCSESRLPARAAARRERDHLPRLHRFPLPAGPLLGALRHDRGDVSDMTRSVARLLAESLEAHDVDQIFCVPGESYVGLINALTDMNSLRLIVCRHEGGAGYMAVADGRLRSRAGCCIVSRGPGLSNAMVSLHSAYHDATPMVMLVGQVERKDFGRMALQEQNYSRLLSDVTKSVIEVIEPEQASEAIARAFHLAESGTPGPVAVILPEDMFDATTDAEVDQPRPRVLAGPRAEDLDRLADMLAKAERPLVLVGGALLGDALYDEAVFGDLRRLAEEWVLPISPDASPPATVRRDASALRRLYGHSRAAGADHRDEARRPDGGDRRAADRQREPVLHFPRRAAAATAAGACLAGCERGRARVAPRAWHRRSSA